MKELSQEVRELVVRARSQERPTPADRERNRKAVLARVGAISAAGIAAGVGSKAAAAAVSKGGVLSGLALSGVAAKVGVVVAIGGAVATGAMLGIWTPQPSAGTPMPATSQQESLEAPRESLGVVSVMPQNRVPEPMRSVEASPSATMPQLLAPMPSGSSLDEEILLLRRTQQELQAGHPDKALELLERQGTKVPSRALAEERAAIRVLALCQSGQLEDGKLALQLFQREHADSVHLPRLSSACDSPRR